MAAQPETVLHASSVAVEGRALLILGPSGSGKSGLALQLMALGAALIADDRTMITLRDGYPWATCPPAIRGRIEARGIGLLAVEPAAPAPVALAVDLGVTETARLPQPRFLPLLGTDMPLLHKAEMPHFPAALLHYLRAGATA